MIFKFLIFAVIMFIIYTLFFKKSAPKKSTKRKSEDDGEIMVECCECSTFVSKDEAIIKNGKFYCSKECAGV